MIVIEGLRETGILNKTLPFNVIVNKNKDFSYPAHWHNELEIIYAYEEGMKLTVNNYEYILNEKDIVIIPGGNVHKIEAHYTEGKKVYIQLNTSILDNLGEIEAIKPFIYQTKVYTTHQPFIRAQLEEHIDKIVKSFMEKELAYNLYLTARICDIFVILLQNIAGKLEDIGAKNTYKKVIGLEKLNEAFKYIEKNYQNNISLSDVSKAVGFSETYFSKIFKSIYGKNFHIFLNEFRLKEFERIFMSNTVTITEAAFSSGFNSITTFNRTFKSIKGCTPSEFMKIKK
ncbi:AraC family transcriptional regulator [Clostridium grantii]|uniref:AraC-type DNA-binding protein n=1 Tax=Clostridium grantii DSM 8605 TaxID=1121316 RepID=A0A1M5T542_9CLOT|nr:AraC family transcriptional regulator [Clostridium grantii]SHH45812.1 AraC-type DNA-binding protein [Clostridium grantii DSM 8605]